MRIAGPALVIAALAGLFFWGLVLVDGLSGDRSGVTRVGRIPLHGVGQLLSITPVVLILVGAQLAVGYGLVRERPWARLLGTWSGLGLGAVISVANGLVAFSWVGLGVDLFWGASLTAVAWWYFYRKNSVVEYYSRLDRSRIV
jgi:hypothetical protein